MLTIFKTTTGKEVDFERLKKQNLSKRPNLGSKQLVFDDGSEMYLTDAEFEEICLQVHNYYLARRKKLFDNTVFP